ncbi:MAG: 2-dehydropantoate 2-reductase [Hyphomicrobiales bacterium]|jgi:2-dehydropantoate 2-reductase|nr:2-dehydropantoate 2-reductase [Hyphomicrobiales bacterium]
MACRRIAVVGAGAIGGVVAWHLAEAGHDPLIVARPQTAAILKHRGMTLTGPAFSRTMPIRVCDDAHAAGVQDLVLVGFKAHDWEAGLVLVMPLIGPSTIIVPMLNGIPWWYLEGLGGRHGDERLAAVDPAGRLGQSIDTARVLGCVVYIGANRTTPDAIGWNGRKRLVIGEPAGSVSPRLEDTVQLLRQGGIDAEATSDIRAEIWHKLLGNACFNPVSALTGATIDAMAADPALREVLRKIMLECIAVARSVGISQLPDVEARLSVHPAMTGVKTSMLQDHEAGRPLELGALVDAVCELGQRTGVPTPMLESLSALTAAAWRSAWPGR